MSKTLSLSDHFTSSGLLRYTLPTVVMMIATSIYSVVDGIFVSNFVGKLPLLRSISSGQYLWLSARWAL